LAASDNESEARAALRAAGKQLNRLGLDWHAVVDRIAEPLRPQAVSITEAFRAVFDGWEQEAAQAATPASNRDMATTILERHRPYLVAKQRRLLNQIIKSDGYRSDTAEDYLEMCSIRSFVSHCQELRVEQKRAEEQRLKQQRKQERERREHLNRWQGRTPARASTRTGA
jgi:hypothetical protein